MAKFASLADALHDGQIAFGRGGFCLKTSHKFREGPVQFKLEFQADHKIISEMGTVRWTSQAENLPGIVVLYVDDPGRGLMAELAEGKRLESYIPRAPAPSQARETSSAGSVS